MMLTRRNLTLAMAAVFGLVISPASAQPLSSMPLDEAYAPRFGVEMDLYRVRSGDPVGSYVSLGSGATTGGELKFSGVVGDRNVSARLIALGDPAREARVQLTLSVGSEGSMQTLKDEEIDLGDLRARSFELLRTDDGAVVSVSLVPRIARELEPPRPMRPADVGIYDWNLNGDVFVDDAHRGTFSGHGGTRFFVSMPDVGRIECSLLPFENATPSGVFHPASRSLMTELAGGEHLRITGVTVGGARRLDLGDGSYRVWVRQTPSEQTPEQALAEVRAALTARDHDLTDEEIAEIERRVLASQVMSSGFHDGPGPRLSEDLERGMQRADDGIQP